MSAAAPLMNVIMLDGSRHFLRCVGTPAPLTSAPGLKRPLVPAQKGNQ